MTARLVDASVWTTDRPGLVAVSTSWTGSLMSGLLHKAQGRWFDQADLQEPDFDRSWGHAEEAGQRPAVANALGPGAAQPAARHQQAGGEVVAGLLGRLGGALGVEDRHERVIEDVLEFVRQAPALPSAADRAVDEDDPAPVRPLRRGQRIRWCDPLDLDAGYPGDYVLGQRWPGDAGQAQQAVGLRLRDAQRLGRRQAAQRDQVAQAGDRATHRGPPRRCR